MTNIFLITDTSTPVSLNEAMPEDFLAFSTGQRDMLREALLDEAREKAALVIQDSLASTPIDASYEERAWVILEDLEEAGCGGVEVRSFGPEVEEPCGCAKPCPCGSKDHKVVPVPICGDTAPYTRLADDGTENVFFCDLEPDHLGTHLHEDGGEWISWHDQP